MDGAGWLRGRGVWQRTNLVHQCEHIAVLRDLDDPTVLDPGEVPGGELHGATVPLWFLAEAGWN